jgi:outer membrane receptor protein involved in Fe transport
MPSRVRRRPELRRATVALALALTLVAARARADADSPPPVVGSGMGEEIVVTGTRTPRPVRDAAEAVTVLPRAELERSATKTVDELLRGVPSFGVFRRSSSVVADPSSQGVNLRGIGPSGVSRSLVLVDGVPANDPFGGWVYWRAIPRMGIERIEVVPGGGSAVYGNYALGGVTQVFSRPIARGASASTECGTAESCLVGARAADTYGALGAAVEGEYLRSRGYPVVAPGSRGAIDALTAPSEHLALNGRLELRAAPDLVLGARGGFFDEDENGGTRFTTAGARKLGYGATARWTPERLGSLDLAAYGHRGEFTQQRAAVTAGRASETLSASQVVPTHDLGGALVWTSAPLTALGTHTLLVGVDARRITGETHEDLVAAGTVREARGQQRLYAVFAQEVYDVTEAVSATFALRWDGWENLDARRVDVDAAGVSNVQPFARRSDAALSPKLGLRVRPLEWLTLRASAYRAFRAPTLNELYRPFQVGLVRTDANESLRAETLDGGEAGIELSTRRGFATRLTGYWNVLHDPITNVTCSTAPGAPCAPPPGAPRNLTFRQRQNLGDARIRGLEADVAWRFARAFVATVGYAFVDSRVTSAPGQPALLGKELPQDPRHRGSVSLAYDDPRIVTAALQVRHLGRQFEDDANALPMSDVTLVDVSLARRLGRHVDVVLAVENLFDRIYLVGRAGVETIGQPRFVRGGLRLHFGE